MNQPTIRKTVLVTIEKLIEIELPAVLATEESLNEWRQGLWDVQSIDDIFKYAARVVAEGPTGCSYDGLGLVIPYGTEPGDHRHFTTFNVAWEDSTEEIKS